MSFRSFFRRRPHAKIAKDAKSAKKEFFLACFAFLAIFA